MADYRVVRDGQDNLFANNRAVILSRMTFSSDLIFYTRIVIAAATTKDSRRTATRCNRSFWNVAHHIPIDVVQ